jgi:hypothetical protein
MNECYHRYQNPGIHSNLSVAFAVCHQLIKKITTPQIELDI